VKDHYKTLGVAEGDDAAAIKKAYRRLAREHHPDRNPDNPDAEAKFKEIQEAYEVLSDPKKRKEYDTFRRNPFGNRRGAGGFTSQGGSRYYRAPDGSFVRVDGDPAGDPFGGETFGGLGDIFSRFFGGDAPESPARKREREVSVKLPFRTALNGGKVRVNLDGKDVRINVPKGVRDGYRVRLKGRGEGRGSVIVVFEIEDDPSFRRIGDDLYTTVEISPFDAMLGASRTIRNAYGDTIKVTFPSGTQPGERLRLRGQGIELDDGTKGDLYVEIAIAVPKSLSREQKEAIRRAARDAGFEPSAS
jgi:DnaJ-class molecular chaperone